MSASFVARTFIAAIEAHPGRAAAWQRVWDYLLAPATPIVPTPIAPPLPVRSHSVQKRRQANRRKEARRE